VRDVADVLRVECCVSFDAGLLGQGYDAVAEIGNHVDPGVVATAIAWLPIDGVGLCRVVRGIRASV
jgi:hypothetical protein